MFLLALLASASQQLPWAAPVLVDPSSGCALSEDAFLVADFNGDGLDDILSVGAINASSPTITASRAPGEYDPPRPALPADSPLPLGSPVLDAADIDGDGILDLVTCSPGAGQEIQVAIGDGTGLFGALRTVATVAQAITEIKLGDVTGDGIADVYFTSRESAARCMVGLGGGQFGGPTLLLAGSNAADTLSLGDLDADGFPDLVTGRVDTLADLAVYYGDGTLPLTSSQSIPNGEVRTNAIVLADLDMDGDTDLLHAGQISLGGGTRRIENLGSRTFGAPVVAVGMQSIRRVEVRDLNLDGLPDIIGDDSDTFTGAAEVKVALGIGPLTWDSPYTLYASSAIFRVGDSDGNPVLDLLVSHRPNPQPPHFDVCAHAMRRGQVNAQGQFVVGLTLLEERSGFTPLSAADFDGDGLLDPVIADALQGRVIWRRSLGDGRLGDPQTNFELAAIHNVPIPGDFNGDGFADVLYVATQGTFAVRFGDGAGSFGSPVTVATGFMPQNPRDIRVRDLDANGIDDVLWVRSDRSVYYAFGQSSGIMTPIESYSFPGFTNGAIADGDVDADGDTDLVLFQGRSVSILTQTAPGTFSPPALLLTLPRSAILKRPQVVDGNGDGIRDIFFYMSLGGGQGATPNWIFGQGGGAFAAAAVQASPIGLTNVFDHRAMDYDLDGDADLLRMQGNLNGTYEESDFQENLGTGVLAPGVDSTESDTTSFRSNRLAADLDGDGDLDMIFGTPSGELFIALNRTNGDIGVSYCGPASANSTGQPGEISAEGSTVIVNGDTTLIASSLPPASFGFFITSRTQGFNPNPIGSSGPLCLGGAIGRFSAPNEIRQVNQAGEFSLTIDLAQIPTPQFGGVAVQPGETWNFQAWHRDMSPAGSPTSNFTDGLSLLFR